MKKYIYTIIAVLLFNFTIYSQIDNIKLKSRGLRLGNDIGFNSGNNYGGAFFAYLLFRDLTILTIDAMITHHYYLLENADDYPIAFSADYMPHFAFNSDNQYTMFQRIRGTYGVFSTDLRLNYLAEFSNMTVKSYSTLDWQIIQFSMYPSPNTNIRFGTGLMHDNYSNLTFNEHSLGLELYFFDYQYWFTIDGRYAFDYNRVEEIYSELNFRASYRFFQSDHLNTYFTLGALTQNYYTTTHLSSIQAGLTLNIR